MKKKIIIPILILLIIIPIIVMNLSNNKKEKQLKQAAVVYKNAIKDYSKNKHIENGDYVVDDNGIHNEKYNYKFEINDTKPQNGSITIYNDSIERACLTINNNKIIIENDEIISQEQGICEYEIIPTKEEYAKEYIRNYVDQIPSIDITESGIYDVTQLNEQILLIEYPQEGWVSVNVLEERLDVQSYSIKFNDIVITNIDGTQKITQNLEPRL